MPGRKVSGPMDASPQLSWSTIASSFSNADSSIGSTATSCVPKSIFKRPSPSSTNASARSRRASRVRESPSRVDRSTIAATGRGTYTAPPVSSSSRALFTASDRASKSPESLLVSSVSSISSVNSKSRATVKSKCSSSIMAILPSMKSTSFSASYMRSSKFSSVRSPPSWTARPRSRRKFSISASVAPPAIKRSVNSGKSLLMSS